MSLRSAVIRLSRSAALLRLRVGIIAPRLVQPVSVRRGGGSVAVVIFRAGTSRVPPSSVRQACPDGDVQVTVPSGA